MENLHKFAEDISNLTVLECYKLAKILKEEYGISPKTQIMGINVNPVSVPEVIEKTTFDVTLKSLGEASKLNVVKTLKEITGVSLLEAKNLVDNLPCKIKENVDKNEATALENSLKELGAEIEVL